MLVLAFTSPRPPSCHFVDSLKVLESRHTKELTFPDIYALLITSFLMNLIYSNSNRQNVKAGHVKMNDQNI